VGGLLEEEIAAVREGRVGAAEFERNRAWLLAELERMDGEPLELALELARGGGGPWGGADVRAALAQMKHDAFTRGVARLLAEEGAIRILYSPQAATRGAVPEAYRRTGGKE
jgi:hypothetical protein